MYKRKCGIYSIYNQVTKKRYIGSSANISRRWGTHKNKLRGNKNPNRLLQEEWNKYGEENFIFSILELCQPLELIIKEDYWCEFYKSNFEDYGYNIMPIVYKEDTLGRNKRIYTQLVSRDEKGLSVIVINKLTGEYTEYNSCIEVSEKLQIPYKKIWDLLHYWKEYKGERKAYRNWIMVKKEEYNPEFDYIGYRKPVERKKKEPKVKPEPKPYDERTLKRVALILENIETGEIIPVRSLKEAEEVFSMNTSKIYRCVKNEYRKYKHKGFYIKYAN